MPFLPAALESIMGQTYTNLEILCINDGSTDETGSILEKYAAQDRRIRVIHNESNIKLIQTLNKGIELSNGEYIARMDADDITAYNRIEVEIKYMLSNPQVDIVSCGLWVISEKGDIISKLIPRQFCAAACLFASFFYVPIGHPELLIRTSLLKQNHYLNEAYALHVEDYELWSRLLRNGYILHNINAILHYFRINTQSVSRKHTELQDNNFMECARRHYFIYCKKSYSAEIIRVMVNRIDNKLLLSDLRLGINEIKRFKSYFIKKENITDNQALKEIQTVYHSHVFDISFQVIKKSTISCKVFAMLTILINLKMFFNKRVLTYLKNKIIK